MIKFCGFRGHEFGQVVWVFYVSKKKEKKMWTALVLGSKLTCLTPPHWWCYLSLEVNSSFGYWLLVVEQKRGLGNAGGKLGKTNFFFIRCWSPFYPPVGSWATSRPASKTDTRNKIGKYLILPNHPFGHLGEPTLTEKFILSNSSH